MFLRNPRDLEKNGGEGGIRTHVAAQTANPISSHKSTQQPNAVIPAAYAGITAYYYTCINKVMLSIVWEYVALAGTVWGQRSGKQKPSQGLNRSVVAYL
jgi:hypothetical protein